MSNNPYVYLFTSAAQINLSCENSTVVKSSKAALDYKSFTILTKNP